ncbi:NVEALA domain-containing protein [Phocaeicola sartorii]|jgi:hypothetical protein|uniref:NVEALA domain-containing protein n=1 Tax=Phocaeicola sartorii TaxID=671267 RepID=UPI00374C8B2F
MKKKILKATIVASFALIAGMNVYNAQKSDVMSELALANVEALASGEGSGGFDCCNTCSGCLLWIFYRYTGNWYKIIL